MLSTAIGIGCIMFSIGSFIIKSSRFTKVKDFSGITIIKDKQTGCEYIQYKNGNITKL